MTTEQIRFMSAEDDTVVFVSIKGDEPLLATALNCETEAGTPFPTVSFPAKGYATPVVFLVEPPKGSIFQFRLADYTMGQYFNRPSRRQLAGFYSEVCARNGWALDDHVTLNVVYYLEKNGIDHVHNGNLASAMDVVQAIRFACYRYLDVLCENEAGSVN